MRIHERILAHCIEQKRVPHLMLFSGSTLAVMKKEALNFAKQWLQSISSHTFSTTYPDIHIIATEGKLGLHPIDSIRLMLEKMAYEPYEAAGKVFIVEAAERMLPTSANALLKNLEEPLGQTAIILLTTKEELLLPTIRSRAMKIGFYEARPFEECALDPKEMVKLLASGPRFADIADAALYIASALDMKKRALEKEIGAFYTAAVKEMNAHQKQKIEQEIEGAVTTQWFEEVERLLCMIYGLYRDRHVHHVHGESNHCLFPDAESSLPVISLEYVNEVLSFAKLALERSTPVQNVFETLISRLQK